MPRESWLRRRRKHWPDQSRSSLELGACDVLEVQPRCDWIERRPVRDERRHHFPGRSTRYYHLSLFDHQQLQARRQKMKWGVVKSGPFPQKCC